MKSIRIILFVGALLLVRAVELHAQDAVTLTMLWSFNGTNGGIPDSVLTQTSDGTLYGTSTGYIGDGNIASVFKITTNRVFSNLFTFDGTNLAYPSANLILGSDGSLYATTHESGSNQMGTVFKI